MKKIICPFCGCESVSDYENRFICDECERLFDEEDIVREEIRHKISAILMDTDEENQMKCEICIENDEACGLSTLEMDWIDSCFQVPCEGTIWFHYQGYDNFITGEKNYKNFDEIDTKDLKIILDGLAS